MAQGLDGDKFVQGAFLNTDDGCRELLGGCHDSVCSHDLWDQDGMVDEAKGVGDAFATGVGHDHLNSAIMMFCMQQILSLGGWYSHMRWRSGFRWTRTSVPTGAIGVALKKSNPWSALHAERRGF